MGWRPGTCAVRNLDDSTGSRFNTTCQCCRKSPQTAHNTGAGSERTSTSAPSSSSPRLYSFSSYTGFLICGKPDSRRASFMWHDVDTRARRFPPLHEYWCASFYSKTTLTTYAQLLCRCSGFYSNWPLSAPEGGDSKSQSVRRVIENIVGRALDSLWLQQRGT